MFEMVYILIHNEVLSANVPHFKMTWEKVKNWNDFNTFLTLIIRSFEI